VTDPIRIILDTTALTAYTNESVHVGEVLAEITDNGALFAVPDLCLAEATAELDEKRWPWLDVLLDHPRCVRIGCVNEWRALGFGTRVLGTLGRAAAMLATAWHDAYLLTAEPDAYGDDQDTVIAI
jgi:hypothetical protein